MIRIPNLQDSSDCAKNRAPHRSWVVIDVKMLVWSKSRSELGDIEWKFETLGFSKNPHINPLVKLSQNPLQIVVLGVVLNFDELYLQTQIDFVIKLNL